MGGETASAAAIGPMTRRADQGLTWPIPMHAGVMTKIPSNRMRVVEAAMPNPA